MLVNFTFPRTICVSEHTKQTHNPRNTFRRYEMFNKNNLIFQQHTGKISFFFTLNFYNKESTTSLHLEFVIS